MVHSIDEDLALDKIKASLKQIPLINDALINAKGELIFRFTVIKILGIFLKY